MMAVEVDKKMKTIKTGTGTETLVKAEGLKHSLISGIHITALVVLKNGLQPVKMLSVKLRKRDSDICKAPGQRA